MYVKRKADDDLVKVIKREGSSWYNGAACVHLVPGMLAPLLFVYCFAVWLRRHFRTAGKKNNKKNTSDNNC